MIVAEIIMTTNHGILMGGATHKLPFTDLSEAVTEYERVKDLMVSREDRKNDLPKTVTAKSTDCEITFCLADLHSIAFSDYAKANENVAGTADAFPHLFKR